MLLEYVRNEKLLGLFTLTLNLICKTTKKTTLKQNEINKLINCQHQHPFFIHFQLSF